MKKGKKFYTLVEFPYPSGNLHTGHWYAFAVPDIFVRMKRMQGHEVMFPIGFDAFGLPAENAAIKRKINPKKWTYGNIKYMEKQLKSMGASFDWERKVVTSDPEYYRWTQWLFLRLFEKGLAYQAETVVNWCPQDKTVLANEQVVNGCCERCDSEVVQKKMKQWILKITDYAERLLNDLEGLPWKEEIKEAQRNWIGKSEGAEIKFSIYNSQFSIKVFTTRPDTLFGATYMVLAPEHDLIGRMADNIENWDEVKNYIEKAKRKTELERKAGEKEKTGVELKGVKAINPANNEEIPIWVADYVLVGYGTGAIMAVPAHDERDFEFAKKFGLPIKRVVEPKFYCSEGDQAIRSKSPMVKREAICAVIRNPKDNTYLCNVWKNIEMHGLLTGGIDGKEEKVKAALREIREETGYKNVRLVSDPQWAINTFFYHRQKDENRWAHFHFLFFELENEERDSVSQEELAKHEFVWKKKEELRKFFTVFEGDFVVKLLENPEYVHTGQGIMANSGKFDGVESEKAKKKIIEFVGGKVKTQYKLRDWVVSRQRYWGCPIPIIHCAKCGAQAVPEKDLPVKLPEIKDYLPTGEGKSPLAKAKKWMSVKCTNCKEPAERETDTLDTFVDSSWYFLRYCDPKNRKEFAGAKKTDEWMPVDLYSGGAEHTTMHLLYSRFFYKAMADCGLLGGGITKLGDEPYRVRKNRGIVLGPDGQKMSKSRGNVIDPDEYVKKLGADTVRMYLAFLGPYDQVGAYPWDPKGILGIKRFLDRVDKFCTKLGKKSDSGFVKKSGFENSKDDEIKRLLHKTIKKVTEDIEEFKFNTAISSLMTLLNSMEVRLPSNLLEVGLPSVFLRLLTPFAPITSEKIWKKLKLEGSVHKQFWPVYDPKLIKEDTFELVVQVNGKVRDKYEVPVDITQKEAEELTLRREKVKLALENKNPKKIIFVPQRLINLVI